MPRPAIDLEKYRAEIEVRIYARESHTEVLQWLESQGVVVAITTLRRRLHAWGIVLKPKRLPQQDERLRERIKELMGEPRPLTDNCMVDALRLDGFRITTSALQRVRLDMGLRRKA